MASVLLVLGETLLLGLGLASVVYYVHLVPPTEPRGIPVIPFWVALIPLFSDVDQQDIFNRYIDEPLRSHGAVKIFFASKWNVLVHQPAYLNHVFKYENQYQKTGNHKKIPGSVLASFLGDNIISSHGETWKKYRQVIQPGLQRRFELDALFANARRLRDLLLESQAQKPRGGIPIQESIQRYTIANFGQINFGVDFGTLESSQAYLHQLQYGIKREIFKPIFMNFPFLDRLGFPGRERARRLAGHFTDQLVSALERRAADAGASKDPVGFEAGDLPSSMLAARDSGTWSEQQFRDNVTVLFVAGQENPQLAIISTFYLLAKHPDIQDQLADEIASQGDGVPSEEALQNMPLLDAVVLESLRLFPPIGQLINRRAAEPLILGDSIMIPQGAWVGYNCYSTNRDPSAWGADASQFRPQRWGHSIQDIRKEYRRRRARAEFVSFHGGRRACLGERFAVLQMKATLFTLAKELRWRPDPTWPDRMTPAGPLCPRNLRLVVEARKGLSDVTRA